MGTSSQKISLTHQRSFSAHRCGWNYAIQALQPLHSPRGILFDGFLESSFLWKNYKNIPTNVPYHLPWVGFLHNPPNMPKWFGYQDSPQTLFAQADWQESLRQCKGLFCLSEYHAQWLRQQTNLPVSALIHPTELSVQQFDYDKFINNPRKKIVQLGWWLRKLTAIYRLPISKNNRLGYQKIKLNPAFSSSSFKHIQDLVEQEKTVESLTFEPAFLKNTHEVHHLDNGAYDELLSQNIGLSILHDASANNVVIECIARATPLLINPLPAVVEYLGKDYPMYVHNLPEAAEKAIDLEIILSTHRYLQSCSTRAKLSASYFRESFKASEVYQQI